MSKDLSPNKVYNYFHIGDAKTAKVEGKVEYTFFLQEQKPWFWQKNKSKLKTKPSKLSHRT